MFIYLILLVASVFLGTKILAIETPIAQITPYRLLVFGLMGIFIFQLFQRNPRLRVKFKSVAGLFLLAISFWWLWAFFSGLWAEDFGQWFRAMFLLTLGMTSIWGVYLYTPRIEAWYYLLVAIWLSMSVLVLWGYIEITFNFYPFANMAKLDKHSVFASSPLSRIPVTIFENQNDFATMLGAYIALCPIIFTKFRAILLKLIAALALLAAVYLVYRSQSRTVLAGTFICLVSFLALQVKWDLSTKRALKGLVLTGFALLVMILLLPSLREKLLGLVYTYGMYDLTGDQVRINLWRNGLVFVGQTFGLGVGAGNIEHWMAHYPVFPVEVIVNMHNWWLEILTAYGVLVFIAYVTAYLSLLFYLIKSRAKQGPMHRVIASSFAAFLLMFIFTSVTSANNLLIEWHWVYFALIIAYVKLADIQKGRDGHEHHYITRRAVAIY